MVLFMIVGRLESPTHTRRFLSIAENKHKERRNELWRKETYILIVEEKTNETNDVLKKFIAFRREMDSMEAA